MIELEEQRTTDIKSGDALRVSLGDLLRAKVGPCIQRGKRPGQGYGTPQNPKSDCVFAGTLKSQEPKQLNSNTLENFKKSSCGAFHAASST